MIPKIIHYCWFGGNPKSELIEKCIESWRIFCPDWQIVEWNETNYDVGKIPYVKEAYELKKWAFVSDYARLDIIYNNGGVYLDTDVELYKTPEEWLQYEAVFAFETSRNINTGQGFAALKGNEVVEKMMGEYKTRHFLSNGKIDLTPCPIINTTSLQNHLVHFKRNGMSQVIRGVKILSGEEYQSFATHHYTGTWVEGSHFRAKFKATRWKKMIRNPKVFEFIERHFGKKVVGLYQFYCYDLQEYGFVYFIKRKLRK